MLSVTLSGVSDSYSSTRSSTCVLGSRGEILLWQIYKLLLFPSCIPGDSKHWEDSGKLNYCPDLPRLTLRVNIKNRPTLQTMQSNPKIIIKILVGWIMPSLDSSWAQSHLILKLQKGGSLHFHSAYMCYQNMLWNPSGNLPQSVQSREDADLAHPV